MLDVKKLVTNIRTMKTLLKHTYMTSEVKERIKNIENHIINLDSSSESSKSIHEDDLQNITNDKLITHSYIINKLHNSIIKRPKLKMKLH